MSSEQAWEDLWMAMIDLATQRGVGPMNALPGLWRVDLGDGWELAVNGQRETIAALPPFHAGVTCGGFPVAVFNPYGGVFVGSDTDRSIEDLTGMVRATSKVTP